MATNGNGNGKLLYWITGALLAILMSLASYTWNEQQKALIEIKQEVKLVHQQLAKIELVYDRRMRWHERALERMGAPGFVPMGPEGYMPE